MPTNNSDFVNDIDIQLITALPFVKLFQINGTNNLAVDCWIQVFDTNAAPINNDIPIETYLIKPEANFSIGFINDLGKPGRPFNNGIAIAYSSTQSILTSVVAGTLFAVWWNP